jgi:hypothetical protein
MLLMKEQMEELTLLRARGGAHQKPAPLQPAASDAAAAAAANGGVATPPAPSPGAVPPSGSGADSDSAGPPLGAPGTTGGTAAAAVAAAAVAAAAAAASAPAAAAAAASAAAAAAAAVAATSGGAACGGGAEDCVMISQDKETALPVVTTLGPVRLKLSLEDLKRSGVGARGAGRAQRGVARGSGAMPASNRRTGLWTLPSTCACACHPPQHSRVTHAAAPPHWPPHAPSRRWPAGHRVNHE